MNKLRNTINKIASYTGKIEKKKRRDRELSENLGKAKSLTGNNIARQINEFKSDNEHLEKVRNFNKIYLGNYKDFQWNMFMSIISGNKTEKYIPEDAFVTYIEPRLNNVSHVKGFQEKNLYDLFFQRFERPVTLIRYIKGDFFDIEYNYIRNDTALKILVDAKKTALVKPSLDGHGQGRGIKLFNPGEENELIHYIENNELGQSNFIVQEWIDQHAILSEIFPSSVNTLKIITLRVRNKIKYLMSRFNIGRGDMIVDKGGYFAGVNDNGYVNSFAFDTKNFKKCEYHEDTGKKFSDIRVPSFNRAVEMCKKAHKYLLHFDMASWDIAIDRDGKPLLIEVNIQSQGVGYIQIANGPLFGSYTEELLSSFS